MNYPDTVAAIKTALYALIEQAATLRATLEAHKQRHEALIPAAQARGIVNAAAVLPETAQLAKLRTERQQNIVEKQALNTDLWPPRPAFDAWRRKTELTKLIEDANLQERELVDAVAQRVGSLQRNAQIDTLDTDYAWLSQLALQDYKQVCKQLLVIYDCQRALDTLKAETARFDTTRRIPSGLALPGTQDIADAAMLRAATDRLLQICDVTWKTSVRAAMMLDWAEAQLHTVNASQQASLHPPNLLDQPAFAAIGAKSTTRMQGLTKSNGVPLDQVYWPARQALLAQHNYFHNRWAWLIYWCVEAATEQFRASDLRTTACENVLTGAWLYALQAELRTAPAWLIDPNTSVDIRTVRAASQKPETQTGADIVFVLELPDGAGCRTLLLQTKKFEAGSKTYKLDDDEVRQYAKLARYPHQAAYGYQLLWDEKHIRPGITAQYVAEIGKPATTLTHLDPYADTSTLASLMAEALTASSHAVYASSAAAFDALARLADAKQLTQPQFIQIVRIGLEGRALTHQLLRQYQDVQARDRLPGRRRELER
ncbi:hypothetical protein [Andreprevotia chitinilytica]|uniref:hypothetical protein n=1 Tax=Andreprevotia chitinilytica TaxID=396808 RepID=UPI00054FA883|nr:hypothetical protein [Andreprevotia chitinilytica]